MHPSIRCGLSLPFASIIGLAATPTTLSAQCAQQWAAMNTGLYGAGSDCQEVTVLANGDIAAGGNFQFVEGVAARGIARWEGVGWSAMGDLNPGGARAITELPNGDIIAGGNFSSAGGVAANRIARWDGSSWSPLGAGLNNVVTDLVTLPNGDVVASGLFTATGGLTVNHVARWDGTSWSAMGSGLAGRVFALTTLPNGDVIAGGQFASTTGGVTVNRVARWNGTIWSAMGSGMNNQVTALHTMANGDVIAGGSFGMAGGVNALHVARWNGASWSPLGGGIAGYVGQAFVIGSVTSLPSGDIVVGGFFPDASGVPASNIARWDGGSWHAVGGGTSNAVTAVAIDAYGDIVAGGTFLSAGGAPASHIARYASCPATVVEYGSGCTGSGGLNELVSTNLPRVGATFEAEATGMPSPSFAVAAVGFVPIAIPLPFAEAIAGCEALVTPDALSVVSPVGGTVKTQITIPNTASVIGALLHHQVVPFDLSGSALAITSTNALKLTLGT